MSEKDEESFKSVQLEQNAPNTVPELSQSNLSAACSTVTQSTETDEKKLPPASSTTTNAEPGEKWNTALNQFKLKRFFVLRVISQTV